jgi:hypothetical protein
MKAVEFTSNLKNKTIAVPENISGYIENGKKVRVILLLEDNNNTNAPSKNKEYKAAGSLNKFASSNKVAEEKTAWEKHVKDKYGNH